MCVHLGEGNKSSGTFYHLLGNDQAQVFATQALLASLTHDASADNDISVFVFVFGASLTHDASANNDSTTIPGTKKAFWMTVYQVVDLLVFSV